MSVRFRLRRGGACVRAVRFSYERTIKWNDNVPETGGVYALLTLETEDGLVGVSEATLKPIWTGSSVRSIIASIEDILLPRLMDVDLGDAAAVSAAMAPIPENMAGKTLIDNACWDLRAQAAGEPLWKLLGGQREVAMSWTLTRAAPEIMVQEALAMVEQHGFKTLKLKGGQGIAIDTEAVRLIRRALGDEVVVYMDANWHYSPVEGLEFAKAIAAEGAALVEDPWTLQPDAEFKAAHASVPVPILVDYFCNGARDAPVFVDYGARAFSVKPGRIGISDARAMARICAQSDAAVVVGMFAETQIGSLHTLSFASAHATGFAAESSFFLMFRDSPLTTPLRVENGMLALPTSPGFAPLVDWAAVDRACQNV